MEKYHKIQTIFKRDSKTKFKTVIMWDYALPEFAYLQDNQWQFTEKVDGTNIRVMFDGENIAFGGKSDNAQIPIFLLDKLNEIFLPQIDNFKSIFDCPVCLYGEGYGAKIQKGGGNYRQDQSFVLFDAKIQNWWLKREDVEDIAKKLNIDIVPIIGIATLHEMVDIVSNGFKSQWGDFQAEGIVARPQIELKTRAGGRIITKLKHKDFVKEITK